MSRKFYFIIILFTSFIVACSVRQNNISTNRQSQKIIISWNEILLNLVQTTEGYRPPVSARMYAYMGFALWEVSRPILNSDFDLKKLCPEYQSIIWDSMDKKFIYDAAVNACYYHMCNYFFPNAIMSTHRKYLDFYQQQKTSLIDRFSKAAVESSETFGFNIALQIFNFSKLDKNGHQSFAFNFDQNYAPERGEGKWESLDSMPALLPHWNKTRTFLLSSDSVIINPPLIFSNERSSAFFAQALEVFNLSRPLTEERSWIAEFWSDDFHGITFCAVSRWISIYCQLAEQDDLEFQDLVAGFVKLGIGLNDATVFVWTNKYKFNIERPDTYIRRNINKNWEPLHHTPNFPGYPSGHAVFGSTAGAILKSIFGTKINFSDHSHESSKEFNGKPRSFQTIDQMVEENAISRLYLGVHFRMDCEEGLRIGKIFGEKAGQLNLSNTVIQHIK